MQVQNQKLLKPTIIEAPKQNGFTLIELMVSLVLGLIISAAAFQLFANSANSIRVQSAVSDIQDAAVFSMSYMSKEIAMANLGATTPMTQESAWTGVVLTGNIGKGAPRTKVRSGNLRGLDISNADTANIVTKNLYGPNNITAPAKSDQLTIQYKAPFDGKDCEGNDVNQGDMVIERFFTRIDNQRAAGESTTNNLAIVLACDAGRYQIPAEANAANITTDVITVTGFNNNGTILVNRVDDFEVKLGVQLKNGIAYVSIEDYMAQTNGVYNIAAPIVAVQIGVITRGNNPVSGATNTSYTVNGANRTIDTTDKSYARRVYQSVISLRNNGVAK